MNLDVKTQDLTPAVVRWRSREVETGRWTWLRKTAPGTGAGVDVGGGGRRVFAVVGRGKAATETRSDLIELDLATGRETAIVSHGDQLGGVAVSSSGRELVTVDALGAIRVGSTDGGEPHLLLGATGAPAANALAISPDGRWIASAADTEIRLWPMPDVSKPPLHALPYDQLMAKLRALTNVYVIADPAGPTGYRVEVGPFPGWKDVPTW